MSSTMDLGPKGPRPDQESALQFEGRKVDHIRLSLDTKNQADGLSGLDQVHLEHEALPDLDFSEISIQVQSLGQDLLTPFLVSSMTAGHADSTSLNLLMASACAERGWRMGVGSQRRELSEPEVASEWRQIRQLVPRVQLLGNLGISQLIRTETDQVEALVEALEAKAMIIHLNALQECLQPEGTPNFKGSLKAIERLCQTLSVPVVIKETGCGFSAATLARLKNIGVAAVDISGLGGTHWGRIEGDRNHASNIRRAAAESLASWGIPTVESMRNALALEVDYEIWASGGVRSGLDAAKLLAMGAQTVGFAMPILNAALLGERELLHKMSVLEYELKTALFCTGCSSVADLQSKKVWQWRGK